LIKFLLLICPDEHSEMSHAGGRRKVKSASLEGGSS
jgi:hypothetical protein